MTRRARLAFFLYGGAAAAYVVDRLTKWVVEREKDLSIENNVRDLLHKIDRALKRIDEGTYGLCSVCGRPIEKARIKALPYVDLCIKDAKAQTRR